MQPISGPAVSPENTSRAETVTDFRLERLRRILKNGWTPAALTLAEEYATNGLAEAQYLLAQMLASTGRPEDTEAAKRWYEAAARQGHVPACKELWQRTACATSLELMIRAADLGDYQASGLLIMRHGCGQSPDVQVPNMVAYMQRHVASGHAYAQKALGAAYDFGRFGLPRDLERAFELYMLAARQGDASAQCWVGICYGHGLGVKQDEEQAVYWYRESAKRGNAQAQYNLGHWYAIGHKPCIQSMSEANRWYRRAALRDFPQAQHNLGLSYRLGSALPQNHELANRWIARAAQHGLPEAQCTLGVSYERGLGVEPNPSKAAELYKTAATSGYALAQHKYAYLLDNGLGVAKNPVEAVRWYLAAAEQGLAVAQNNLATMYMVGSGVEKDLTEAVRWRRKAAEQGLADAQHNLAWMYVNGVGVEKNPMEALRWCQAAAEQGHAIAQRELPAYLAYGDQQRELPEARNALSAIEVRLRAEDPTYEAKKALLVPILKPVFEQMPPSKWAVAFERAYANVQLPAENTIPKPCATGSAVTTSTESKKVCSEGTMTVLLYELSSHPGEVGISKIDPPVVGGAFFLDFSQPLRVITRQCFGIANSWIGNATELGVPVVHQLGVPIVHSGERTSNFMVYVHRTDPRFACIQTLWKSRYPSAQTAPGIADAGLKIIADFAVQFPEGS